MSNPTTPFSWQMPTATDLVTDLPADFEVFGQAVATSMADLLGGTTGQVLSKTTNADMDFTWTSPNPGDITGVTATSPLTGGGTSGDVTVGIQASSTTQSGAVQLSDSTSTTSSVLAATPTAVKSAYDLANAAIAKTTVTTAGDIIYRNATVPTRLGIGTAGQVLKVNSGATAPEWATASAGALTLISTTNASAASSTVTFSSCFSATYRNYLVMVDGALSASSGFIQIQMRAGATTQSTLYYGGRYQVGTSGSGYSVGQTSASSWEICDGSSNKFSIAANIMTPYVGKVQMNTRYWTRNGDTGGIQQGFIDTTTSYDSMVLAFSGTFTGTVSIYGYGI